MHTDIENFSFPNYSYTPTNYSEDVSFICNAEYSSPVQSPVFQTIIYIMYSIVFVVSITGNGMICYIVINSARMRTITNYFIMNLAIGDILITIFCVPFTSVSYLQQYWTFGSFLCPVVNYSQAVSVFVSAYTMLVISVDRYMAIMWPLKRRITKKIAAAVVVILWVLAGATALPIPIFSRLVQPNNTWYIYCDKYICSEDWSEVGQHYEKFYTVMLMMMQYVIPLSVLVFTYTSIGVVIWCHRIPGEAENSRDQRIARSKRKMIKMMVIVVFVFTLCWLPFNVLWILQEEINNNVLPYLWFALHWLAMSHACYNPIIYCYMNSRYRVSFLQALAVFPFCRNCIPMVVNHLNTSATTFRLKSLERTDSTLLQRNNTYTTYINAHSKKSENFRSRTNLQVEAPVRSVSLMRNHSPHNNRHNNKENKRNNYHINEQQI